MMGSMMAGMGFWGILLIVTVLAVLTVAVLGSMWLLHKPDAGEDAWLPDGDAALDTLRRRYASGEIEDEEYERRLSALTQR